MTISRNVNLSINEAQSSLQVDNINDVMIITSEQGGVVSSANRFASYRSLASVATDFGTYSQAYQFASSFFSTTPNAVNAGGNLHIGYWRGASEDVAATAGHLISAEVNEISILQQLRVISDGEFTISVDGTSQDVTALDFRTISTMADVITVINAVLTGSVASYDSGTLKFKITSSTTGVLSIITFASIVSGGIGTDIGSILSLNDGSGASVVAGAAIVTLSVETKLAGITELRSQVSFYGAMFIDKPSTVEAKTLATWSVSSDVLLYDVFSAAANLDKDVSTNVCWDITLSGLDNYRMIFSAANNRKLAASYMARMHTVNFDGSNTAITMELKKLSESPESYTSTELNSMQEVGLDCYILTGNVSRLYTSGANKFTDYIYNLIALKKAVQATAFNTLLTTSTKVSMTDVGIAAVISDLERTTKAFVRSGVIGTGLTWNSSDVIGNDLDVFNDSINQKGYYWYSVPASDISQVNRENRTITIQAAVKFAGAVHVADITINIEE